MTTARPHMPPLDGILEAALYADDLETAEAFYAGVLGLEVVLRMDGRHVFFRCGDTVLLVFDPAAARSPGDGDLAAPPHGADGPGHVCFSAPEPALSDWEETLTAAGHEIERRITWPNGARSIYLRDPAGNSVEFAEPKLWERAPDDG